MSNDPRWNQIEVSEKMALKTTRNPEEDITIHVITGPASEDQMNQALTEYYAGEPTTQLLWDMSQADVAHVTPERLRRFIERAAELSAAHPGGRTAVIAPHDLQFGLARMSEVFSELESAPFLLRAFRTRKEALAWLKSGHSS